MDVNPRGANANPLALRRRLAARLTALRSTRGWSHAETARRAGLSTAAISRTENPVDYPHKRPQLDATRRHIAALTGWDSDEFTTLAGWAEQSVAPRWWDAHPRMGDGQRTAALIECAATAIHEYAGVMLPGLAQCEAFTLDRVLSLADIGWPVTDPHAIVEGRIARQQHVLANPGLRYHLLIEVQAVTRLPSQVRRAQLNHLQILMARPGVEVRVLPDSDGVGAHPWAREAFAHVAYVDQGDPPIVLVDDVRGCGLVADEGQVKGHLRLHEQLWDHVALSDADSEAFIRDAARRAA